MHGKHEGELLFFFSLYIFKGYIKNVEVKVDVQRSP